MRTYSRQNMRTFHRQSGIPRTFSGQKPVIASLKESQISVGKYKYDSNDEIGRGFSGNVFKAVQIKKQHKRYAIKVVNLKKFKGQSLDMLEAQIQIHRNLDHERVVKLHQVIKTPHFYYLVMEYCPHGNLSEYIAQKKQLSQSNALEILGQIISAYKYLLEEGVVHRDIKPANILRVGNKWKISDFGFSARARFGFKDRVNVGTPLYMAPESFRRNFYSFKSDFFSIGVVLYEMLEGKTPHEAHSQRELLDKISLEIPLPNTIKNAKLAEFFLKSTIISDAKRLNRDEFQSFDFTCPAEEAGSLYSSQIGSIYSQKGNSKGSVTNDETSRGHNSVTDISSKTSKQGSKVSWNQSYNGLKQEVEESVKIPKNPIQINQDILNLQFQFVHHHYLLIQNIDSLHCDDATKSMLLLILFKLLLKMMRLLCDKNQNFLNLNSWEEYQQCKLYQQLYSEFTIASEQYEKEYLEFIKHNDIKVIRAVNRKFPQLCSNNPLTSRFYQNFKEFIADVIRQHDTEITNLFSLGQNGLSDRFQALSSITTIHKLTQIRSDRPKASLLGQKPTLLINYCQSKLTRSDYNILKRSIKDI